MSATVTKASSDDAKRAVSPEQRVLSTDEGNIADEVPSDVAEMVNDFWHAKQEAKAKGDLAKELKSELPTLLKEETVYFVPIKGSEDVVRVSKVVNVKASVKKATDKELGG